MVSWYDPLLVQLASPLPLPPPPPPPPLPLEEVLKESHLHGLEQPLGVGAGLEPCDMWVESSQLYLQNVVEEEEHNGHTDPGEGRIGEDRIGEDHNSYHRGPYTAGTVAVDTVAVDTVAVDMVAVDTVAVVDVAVDTAVVVVVVDFEVVVVAVVVVLVGRGMKLVVVHMETGTLNHKSGHLWVWLDLTAQRMLLTQMGVVWKSLSQ